MHLPAIKDFSFEPWMLIVLALLVVVSAILLVALMTTEVKKPKGYQNIIRLVLFPLFTAGTVGLAIFLITVWSGTAPYTEKLVSTTQLEARRVYGVSLDRDQLRKLFTDQDADNGYSIINSSITRYGHAEVKTAGEKIDATLYKVGSEYLLVDASKISTGGITAGQLPHS